MDEDEGRRLKEKKCVEGGGVAQKSVQRRAYSISRVKHDGGGKERVYWNDIR